MNKVALNLWDANEYGDGSGGRGIRLTAYQIDKDLAVMSSAFVSVRLTKADLPKQYVVDDDWFYPGEPSYNKYLQLFVAKQLERKAK